MSQTDAEAPVMPPLSLLHLLQLASPSLPIGAYSYSQGLEAAIDAGLVHDADTARNWIVDHLQQVMARFEAPVCWRLMQAFAAGNLDHAAHWTAHFLAARDSAEFRAETVQMGYSLGQLLCELLPADDPAVTILRALPQVSLPSAYACAAVAFAIPADAALCALLFGWAENQVLVCVKSIPLGQVAGQRLLLSLHGAVVAAADIARQLPDQALSNWAPGLALLSMQHEVQYSRLYRS